MKLGIVSFLTGPAAAPFGIPGRNGAEILIEELNAGKAPAPFNKVGLGGPRSTRNMSTRRAPRERRHRIPQSRAARPCRRCGRLFRPATALR